MDKYAFIKILLISSLSLLLVECSNNCHDTYDLGSFEIFNSNHFSSSDDIIIKAYKKDSTFTVLKDSFKVVQFSEIDNLQYKCKLNKNLNPDFDYDFYFINTKTHCRITGIKIKKEKCYDGLFYDDYSYSFDGYFVDGNLFMCSIIKVFDRFSLPK